MSKNSKLKNNRQNFLLTFFEQETEQYEEKEVNGWWLIKQWNGGAKKWEVHIYPRESYRNYNQNKLGFNELDEGFNNTINKED